MTDEPIKPSEPPSEDRGWNLGEEHLERLMDEARSFRGESLWSDAWRRLRANRAAFGSLLFILAFGLVSFIAPILPLPSPVTIDLQGDLEPPGYGGFADEGWEHRTRVSVVVPGPLVDDQIEAIRGTIESVSRRASASEVPSELTDSGSTRYTFSIPFREDDRPRVDYTETGREGTVVGLRALGPAGGKSRYSFELPTELVEIDSWETRTSPGKVLLEIRSHGSKLDVADTRYVFFLSKAERAPPENIRLNGAPADPQGKVVESPLVPGRESASPRLEITGADGRTVRVDAGLSEWLEQHVEDGASVRYEEFAKSVIEERATVHDGLVVEMRTALMDAFEVESIDVVSASAYWELGLVDRAMVGLRGSMFGLWRTGNWLGTDTKGRDLLSRIIWGSRTSILVALAAALCSLVIGVTYGAFSGLVGGQVDNLMMRIVDVLYSIPFIFVVIFLISIVNSNRTILEDRWGLDRELIFFLVVGAIYWLTMARVVRGQVLSLKNTEFVEATRVIGASTLRILFVHIVPNVLSVVIVYLTLTIPAVMLFEAFLSFLGLGIEPPKVSWGSLASDGTEAVSPVKIYWWIVAFPALAMASSLLALNILGDGLRDALDPKLRGKD